MLREPSHGFLHRWCILRRDPRGRSMLPGNDVWRMRLGGLADRSEDQRARQRAYSKLTRHFTPAGISPFGFGRSSRTPKVPLAESTTRSTMLTLAW